MCRHCAAPIAIFPDHGLRWQHFHRTTGATGTQETYHPGHPAQATWLLPGEDPEDPEEL